ncbi:MAG: lactate racemase domain-containing protein [Thermodesulfobacteriota bacterium]
MNSRSVKLFNLEWFGDTEIEMNFPAEWDVQICYMEGKDAPPLTHEGFLKAFDNPIGTRKIRDLARGKKEVAVVFDDMSRPTNVGQIAHYALAELKAAGVSDSSIRFIVALGAHGAHSLMDFRKKLGDDITNRFPIYNHNPYEGCTLLGKTSRGTPVEINTEFMHCDLKIGIGVITPHVSFGFSGGGKIVLPGLASMDSIWHNHFKIGGRGAPTKEFPLGKLDPSVGLAKYENNALRLDMEEATRMAGLDLKIDAIVNYQRETVALFVGDPIEEHAVGVKTAMGHYGTTPIRDVDLVVTSAYSKANESPIAALLASQILKKAGGDVVVISGAPAGMATHYLVRSAGKFIGGRIWGKRENFPLPIKRLFLISEYADWAGWDVFGPVKDINWMKTWEETVTLLKEDYGQGTKVAVIPDGTIQYFI